jgi:hypothetical protein
VVTMGVAINLSHIVKIHSNAAWRQRHPPTSDVTAGTIRR